MHTVSLPEARAKAKACRQLLLDGKDPLETRKATKLAESLERARAMTFEQCAAAYIKAHRTGWTNAKHADQWGNTLAAYAGPIIGAPPVAEIDTALVVKVPGPLWETKTATPLRGRIEKILDWATVSQYRQGENPARWRGDLLDKRVLLMQAWADYCAQPAASASLPPTRGRGTKRKAPDDINQLAILCQIG